MGFWFSVGGVPGEDVSRQNNAFSFESASSGVVDGVSGSDVFHPVAHGRLEYRVRNLG